MTTPTTTERERERKEQSCPEHGNRCRGADCCCADKHQDGSVIGAVTRDLVEPEPKVCEPYKDGNPMGLPAHRHINPDGSEGGWVAERAQVAPGVYVGPRAIIRGGTIRGGTIYGGTIYGGTIEGGTIRGGTIYGGTIWGGTIWGGTIEGGTIWGGTIRGGTIYGGTIEGGTIRTSRDLLVLGPVGSEDQHVTLVRTETGHRLTIGCWDGENTVDDLSAEVLRRCPDRADEYAEIEAILRRRVAEWDNETKEKNR